MCLLCFVPSFRLCYGPDTGGVPALSLIRKTVRNHLPRRLRSCHRNCHLRLDSATALWTSAIRTPEGPQVREQGFRADFVERAVSTGCPVEIAILPFEGKPLTEPTTPHGRAVAGLA
jgi:hypothetical protein